MRIRNLKHSHPALGLLLFLVAFTTACNIVSGPPSFVSPLYVANFGSNSILIYAAFTNGNVGPANTIIGAATGLSGPSGITLNAAGQIFVANSSANSITVYPLGANGAAAPIRTISGALTLLDNPQGIALDTAGNLYVANAGITTSSITVYAPGASAPSNTITGTNTGLASPQGVVLDPTGRLYVANKTTPSITVYAPGATNSAIPIRTISGGATQLTQPLFIALRP